MPKNDMTLVEKANRYGTPMYVYDGDELKDHYDRIMSWLHQSAEVFFSFKANGNLSIASLLRSFGAGIEVASVGELLMAVKAGYSPQHIIFSGPGKRKEEIDTAIQHQIYCIIAESKEELTYIAESAKQQGKQVSVGIRINPESIESRAKIKMGGVPSPFGIDESKLGEVFDLFQAYEDTLLFKGIHMYLGTQVLDETSLLSSFEYTLNTAVRIKNEYGLTCQMVDLGGGFGIPYFQHETPLHAERLFQDVAEMIQAYESELDFPRFIIEMGRFLLAECGVYLTAIQYVKNSKGEPFLIADGGMHHHQAMTFRGRLLRNNYPMRLIKHSNQPVDVVKQTIVGPLCTPEDLIGRQVELPQGEPGDLLCIEKSGAYGLCYSPTLFLGHSSPLELLLFEGDDYIIRDRGHPEDLLLKQNMPFFKQRRVECETD
ncbi:type III PLP-dependent enzyme [Bacillus sp. 28A-2]|uniref:type III PLP-dependent enzyme n=1 Tax=Bacillus sp. 28A-2 TaxID=2772252 RepID=UPI00168D86D9|nr:type III PLP-dependent enzyme [Bacillus sp. 28A-2]MBD3858272.1 type III PLP-dependent enzyme [Bacillus sp. 28A-2]